MAWIICWDLMLEYAVGAATYPDMPRSFKTPLVPLVPILGVIVCGAMIVG